MRIVSLLPSATEILFAVGAGPEVVAVTHECDFPAEARSLPKVTSNGVPTAGAAPAVIDRHIRKARHSGSSIYELDSRRLAELQPDLIITQELCDVCAVGYREVQKAVRELSGATRILSLEPGSLAEIATTVEAVGEATGHRAAARAGAEAMRARFAAVASARRSVPAPRVVCIEWTTPVMVGGHWVPEMVAAAGGNDPLGRAHEPSHDVEWDEVVAARPDALVLMPCGFGLERTVELAFEVTERPGFAELPAAIRGRVAAVDGSSYFNRPGPRIADGLEILAAILNAEPGDTLPAGAAWVGRARAAAPR